MNRSEGNGNLKEKRASALFRLPERRETLSVVRVLRRRTEIGDKSVIGGGGGKKHEKKHQESQIYDII